jgi:antitoxin CptB
MGYPIEERRKRLRFRAWRRGFREIDLILGAFADAHLAELDEAGLEAFERLLEAPDQDVYEWITGRAPAPPEHDGPTLALIRSFRYFARHAAERA